MKPDRHVSLDAEQLKDLSKRVAERQLGVEDWALLERTLAVLIPVVQQLQQAKLSLKRLQRLLFGNRTEKGPGRPNPSGPAASPGLPEPASSGSPEAAPPESLPKSVPQKRSRGHGRLSAEAYTGAESIACPHPEHHLGDRCPRCGQGRLYEMKPAVEIRLVGHPPVGANRYELERLRCSACGAVLTAPLPVGASHEKCDAGAKATLAALKYGYGMPFHRLAQLQSHLGVPLPAATQWELVWSVAQAGQPVYEALWEEAALADVIYADDSPVKILSLMGEAARLEKFEDNGPNLDSGGKARSGLQTTALVAERAERWIVLYAAGRRHAGENLVQLMGRRPAGLGPPIQMSDALAANTAHQLGVTIAHCLAHARRRFHELREFFPDFCQRVLEELSRVYHHDGETRRQGFSAEQRLAHHQQHSAPVMTRLAAWLAEQAAQRRFEPNSSLGQAVRYLQNHWEQLTQFLRVVHAPLDNNRAEQALKTPILNRKNAYFFKTERGARAGSILMSLMRTAIAAGANPIAYLAALDSETDRVKKQPELWLPWNYTAQQAR